MGVVVDETFHFQNDGVFDMMFSLPVLYILLAWPHLTTPLWLILQSYRPHESFQIILSFPIEDNGWHHHLVITGTEWRHYPALHIEQCFMRMSLFNFSEVNVYSSRIWLIYLYVSELHPNKRNILEINNIKELTDHWMVGVSKYQHAHHPILSGPPRCLIARHQSTMVFIRMYIGDWWTQSWNPTIKIHVICRLSWRI